MNADKMTGEGQLEALVQAVLGSAKYKHVSPDLIRRIGARQLAVRRNRWQAVKATKNKLHQVGGAYLAAKVDYEKGLAMLRETAVSDADFRQTCRHLMGWHNSTRERLGILDAFYATTLAGLPPIRILLDVACGFNPLAFPWMPFDNQVEYIAYDIYADMIEFVQGFMDVAGVKGKAEVRDVIGHPPTRPVDLALILKTLPCLEQVQKTAVSNLLDAIHARYLLISFPARSLGGRSKGMIENYETRFHQLATGRDWTVKRFEFDAELAFLVKTS